MKLRHAGELAALALTAVVASAHVVVHTGHCKGCKAHVVSARSTAVAVPPDAGAPQRYVSEPSVGSGLIHGP